MSACGFFISVEGGEGTGKTLFLRQLPSILKSLFPDWPLLMTREPGGSEFAEDIRRLFLKESTQEHWLTFSEACLIAAARAQHVNYKILPALKRKELVITDRFIDSTEVYQGIIGGMPEDLLKKLSDIACQGLLPDLTFILDCPVEITQARLKNRQASEESSRFDRKALSYHEQVRLGFLQVSKEHPSRCKILDASKTMEEVLEQASGLLIASACQKIASFQNS